MRHRNLTMFMKYKIFNLFFLLIILLCFSCRQQNDYFQIEVLDSATKRGIPIAKISNINGITYYSEWYGNITYNELDDMRRKRYITVAAAGYKNPTAARGRQLEAVTPKNAEHARNILVRLQPHVFLYRITCIIIQHDTYF